jgi:hypothetical protein
MASDVAVPPSRQIRFFSSFEEQEAETIRYWNSQTPEEKLRSTTEIVLRSGRVKQADGSAAGPTRSLVRVPCEPPARVDVLQSIAAVGFENAWKRATTVQVNGHDVRFICRDDLIRNKLAAGRPKDLVDAEALRKFAKGA